MGFLGPCKDSSPSSSSSFKHLVLAEPLVGEFAELDEVWVDFIMGLQAGYPGFTLPIQRA